MLEGIIPLFLVSHVYGEANQATDLLASYPLKGSFSFLHDSLTMDFFIILEADAAGLVLLCND